MNSLQYISTQVDRVIGTVPEEDEDDLAKTLLKEEDDESDSLSDGRSIVGEHPNNEDSSLETDPALPPSKSFSVSLKLRLQAILSIITFPFIYLACCIWSLVWAKSLRRLLRFVGVLPAISEQDGRVNSSADALLTLKHLQSSSSKPLRVPLPRIRAALLLRPGPRAKKTLVLDLDETLIHTIDRGSKFSAGQMVEVKITNRHATLYFVNQRPFLNEFLASVAQWYRLVVFTAAVQEYADPMINWIEREAKYFEKRYYRQHCRPVIKGGYVKDLSIVDSDLANIVIIDNSPVSYRQHPNNAIAISGWINDPSDRHLLNLVPFLQALQYTTDVRVILALRNGEAAFQHKQPTEDSVGDQVQEDSLAVV